MASKNVSSKDIIPINKAITIIMSAVVGTVSLVGVGMYVGLRIVDETPIFSQTVYAEVSAKNEQLVGNTIIANNKETLIDEQEISKDFTIPFKVLTKSETGKLNLRADSDKDAVILAELKDGTDVVSNGNESFDSVNSITWVNVKWGDTVGWVSKEYLSTNENYEQAVAIRQAERAKRQPSQTNSRRTAPRSTSTTQKTSSNNVKLNGDWSQDVDVSDMVDGTIPEAEFNVSDNSFSYSQAFEGVNGDVLIERSGTFSTTEDTITFDSTKVYIGEHDYTNILGGTTQLDYTLSSDNATLTLTDKE